MKVWVNVTISDGETELKKIANNNLNAEVLTKTAEEDNTGGSHGNGKFGSTLRKYGNLGARDIAKKVICILSKQST